jgi:hypothetical protein
MDHATTKNIEKQKERPQMRNPIGSTIDSLTIQLTEKRLPVQRNVQNCC